MTGSLACLFPTRWAGTSGRETAKEHGWPFLGEIPIDPAVRAGGDEGTPVVVSHPDSAVAAAFRETARTLAGKVSQIGRLGRVEA